MKFSINNVETHNCAVIPLRGIVVFPGVSTSIEIARKASIKALKAAYDEESEFILVAQRDITVVKPTIKDMYDVGVTARIINLIKLSNGNYQLIAEGVKRSRIVNLYENEDEYFRSEILIEDIEYNYDLKALKNKMNQLYTTLEIYLKYFAAPSEGLLSNIRNINDPGMYADYAASSFLIKYTDKQAILEISDPMRRLEKLLMIFEHEIEIIELEGSIHSRVKHNLSKAQRDAYLREQLKAIESELGYNENGEDDFETKIYNAKLPVDIEKKLLSENSRLSKMHFGSQEANVIRNYIETCLEIPFNKRSKDRNELLTAERILNEDHEGLSKVKERILEYMAVRRLTNLNGQVLCLVGPPGVGKTSIAKSIARAANRKYVRIALGGIRDEAEIRGHRKTYIGSMPGRLANALKLAGTINPVILLDEVDKLTRNIQGDPTSALLEVLDMDQNKAFRDHFLEFPLDLSECIFIATANTTETIPLPLLDRMELIFMDSYSTGEKLSIAKNHLIPKQMKRHGLKKSNIKFTDEGIKDIIERFTKESGVRTLEREIASVCRKAAKKIVSGENTKTTVTPQNLPELLGAEKFNADSIYTSDEVGMVNGLAWTQLGGEMLRIEALSMNGTGRLELTGHLGDIMKESARAAVSYIRKHASELCIDPDFYKNFDIHIHVPEGAIPKDGPSAGITITTAIVSELTGKTVKQSVAMTGEITLTGRVLPIGGLKEKSMAAQKAGISIVIVPKDNLKDIAEFDDELKSAMKFIGVENIGEVLYLALN